MTTTKKNNIIVYETQGFGGLSKEFTSDVPDLASLNFKGPISSLKVTGQPWITYECARFTGRLYEFEHGEYSDITMNGAILSLKLITENLEDPKITIYQNTDYKGKSVTFTKEENLASFSDRLSSHGVEKGAWILYERGPDIKEGQRLLARAGEKVPDYDLIGFADKLSYVRPLQLVTSKALKAQ